LSRQRQSVASGYGGVRHISFDGVWDSLALSLFLLPLSKSNAGATTVCPASAPCRLGRMGPPLRSFAADAHDCIMVQVLRPTGYKVVARLNRARRRAPPLIVIPTRQAVPSCPAVKVRLGKAENAARLINLDRSSALQRERSSDRVEERLSDRQENNTGQKIRGPT